VKNKYSQAFQDLRCCVVVPTYNNAGTLASVIKGILVFTDNVIIVNDGSTDTTAEVLKNFQNIPVIPIDKNKGKGNALRNGFRVALSKGYDYAITIDSDGQHSTDDIPRFIDALIAEPDTLFIGARNMTQDSVPGKSSFGNKFSNFWFKTETGISLPDTQSGFRLYPIKKLEKLRFFTPKFEFEIEILVRAAWKGIAVKSIPINVYYLPKEERVSHFRPFQDFFRISVLNSVLFLLAIFYFHPIGFFKSFNQEKIRQLFGTDETTIKISSAVSFGVFMGIFPIWGYQMLVAFFLAHLFKLKKALVLLASNISIFPLTPFIMYAGFLIGKVFIKNPVDLNFNMTITLETVKISLVQFFAGSILLAVIAGIFSFLVTYTVITIKRSKR
jgi:glycosyltransferase involved in cell wall biosynthesis